MKTVNSKAVYFPGEIDYLNKDYDTRQLKNALVYFDQIFSIVPEMVFIDNYSIFARSERINRFLLETEKLQEQGIVKYITPYEIYREMGNYSKNESDSAFFNSDIIDIKFDLSELLAVGILSDLQDPIFCSIIDQFQIEPFPLYPSQYDIGWLIKLGDIYNKHVGTSYKLVTLGHSCQVVASAHLGLAVILNHALIASIRYNAVPVSSSLLFERLLNRKIERISQSPEFKRKLKLIKKNSKWSTDFLAAKVLDVTLPELELNSFDDILEVREKLGEQIVNFRFYLSDFVAQIQNAKPENINLLANSIVQTKILPALKDFERKLLLSNDKFFLRIIKTFRTAGTTIPLIATMFAGLPIGLGIILSASAAFSDAALETYFERREKVENNGLSFLLGFRK